MEYIDFDDLQVSDLLMALKDGPQQSALTALDAYLALEAELTTLGHDLYTVLPDPAPDYKKAHDLFDKLLASINSFNSLYGDGLIVGVMWGGYGTVTMQMSAKNQSTAAKYGGAAAFSYSGLGASVSVEATYDGSQSGRQGEVTVQCGSYASGACVEELINKWFDVVSGKSFSALADVDVMKELPSLSNAKGAPAIPDFEKPSPKKSITDKIGEIKELNGLQALAQASAYEDAKKTNPSLTLATFLSAADQKANTTKLSALEKQVDTNELDVLTVTTTNDNVSLSDSPEASKDDEETAYGEGLSGYVPLGIWIANWADLSHGLRRVIVTT